MRYRDGDIPTQLEPLISNGPLMIAAVIGLLTGLGMLLGGSRTKTFWLIFWGANTILASTSYIGYYLFY